MAKRIINFFKTQPWLAAGLALTLGILCAAAVPDAHGAFLPLPESADLDVPIPEGETGIEKLENFLGPFALAIRIIVGAFAVLFMIISGFSMIVGGDNEEKVKTQRQGIIYGVIGLMMISIAGPLAEVFDFRQGNILEDPESIVERAALFDDTTRLVITFVKYLLGSLAALMFIRAGAVMVASGQNDEDITREKKNLALGAGGLVMVMVSDLVVRKILYDAEYNDAASATVISINQNAFIEQLVAVTNIVVTFVGPIMMLGLVAGGVLYVTSGGDEERTNLAKKILLNSLIGVLIIYGAFALVSTVISGIF